MNLSMSKTSVLQHSYVSTQGMYIIVLDEFSLFIKLNFKYHTIYNSFGIFDAKTSGNPRINFFSSSFSVV